MSSTTRCLFGPNRREFVFGLSAALELLWAPPCPAAEGFQYRASSDYLIVVSGAGNEVQRLQSASPVSITVHPHKTSLYVVNDIEEHCGLPRGTVESYRIDSDTGRLELVHRQPLSLSGTRPKALALSPDLRYAVVAIQGGCAYNVLPIEHDGSLGRPCHIFKETEPHRPRPDRVMFDSSGQWVIAGEFESRRTSVFAFRDGRLVRSR